MSFKKCSAIFSVVLLVLFSGALAQGAENLLKNGGFEKATSNTNLPADWAIFLGALTVPPGKVELSTDSFAGQYAVKISKLSEIGNTTTIAQRVKVAGARNYVLKCWLKTNGKSEVLFNVSFQDKNNKAIAQHDSKTFSSSYKEIINWTLVTWKFSAPAGTEYINVGMWNPQNPGIGDILIDEAELNEVKDEKTDAGVSADWKLVFSDDFNSGKLEDNWNVVSGKWSVKDGALYGKGTEGGFGQDAVIICRKELGSNLRLEYTTWTDDFNPCDLSALLCVNPQAPESMFAGYFFGFGSENNSKHKILRDGKEIARTMMEGFSGSIAKGRKYCVVVQRQDDRLSMFIDGKLELQTDDFSSAEISGRGCGFYIYASGNISDVKVYALPDNNTGDRAPEVKAEVSEHSGFESEKIGRPPESIKVETTGGAKAEIVDEPTWVYREDCEEFVADNCVYLAANGGNVSLQKPFKPVNSGIVEFDLLARKPGSEIKVALYDEAQKEVAALIVDKDGVFFTEIGGDRKKIDDTIEYRRRTIPGRFWFQPKRWFTLRIWFDASKGIISSIGVVNLYAETATQPKGWGALKKINQGDYHQLASRLPLKNLTGGIAAFSITAAGDSDMLFDNLCILGPVGKLRANGQNLMCSLRTVMGLDFPARKDPVELKIYSLRNTATKESFKSKVPAWDAMDWAGMSRLKVRQGGDKYAAFTLAATKTYNELLVRQAFVAENADMLERSAYYLKNKKPQPAQLLQELNNTIAVCRTTEVFLGNAYQAYAHAYLNKLNAKELEEKFNPAARELDKALRDAEQQIDAVWKKMPENSLAGDRETPCPMPVDKTPVVWKNGQWLKNGNPVFLYQLGGDVGPLPETEAVFRSYPNVLSHGPFRSVKPGKFMGDAGWFNGLSKRHPECKFNFVLATGVHACFTYTPQWWLDENKDDKDIFFSDEDGKQAPLWYVSKGQSPGASLNFWNSKVKKLEYDLHSAVAGWLKDNAPGKALFFNLLWEAWNAAPDGIETGHNPSAAQAFRAFLQEEYKTIDVLNARWGTKCVSFAEIVPPKRGSPPSGVQYEFQRFRHKGYKDWMLLCRKAIQDKLPDTPIQNDFQDFMGGTGVSSFDMPAYFEMSDIVAFHSYTYKHRAASDRWLDSLRKAYGDKAIGNNEWGAAMTTPEMFDEENYKRSGLVQLFHRMMWGQAMSGIWGYGGGEGSWTYGAPWMDPRLGYTTFRFQTGYVPLHLDRASRLGGPAISAPSVQPDIGILEVSSSYYNALPCDALRAGMSAAAIALENKGYNYGIFYEKLLLEKKQSLKGVQLLIVPNGICLPKDLGDILTDWVKNGGRLIASGALGVYNQYGRPDGTFLRAAFGEGNWEHKAYNNWKPSGGDIKPVETIGKTDLYQHNLGKGTVWLFNTADIYDGKILAACLDLAAKNTDRSFYCKDNKFDLCMREAPWKTFLCVPVSAGKKYLYVLNSSLNDVREDEIMVKGRFSRIADLGLRRDMNVPFKSEQGVTTISLRLAPAEGTLLVLY